MRRDNIHYSLRTIDGYNKPFNLIVSEREVGKSTCLWRDKVFKAYEQGYTSIVLRRQINDITDVYIEDSVKVINKFIDTPIKIWYKGGSLKDGVVDVFVDKGERKDLLYRLIALSNPINRIKSLLLENLRYICFDEFICNPKFKEKYLSDEATRFKELYNTFQRESTSLKAYFFGNPYSLYNPYFVWLGVDTAKLKRGTIQSGVNWVVECYQMLPELREAILKKNPLYQFDDSYTRYAFEGVAINDANIKIGTLPDNYSLRFVFRIEGRWLGIFQNNIYSDEGDRYHCQFVDQVSARRVVYCFEFTELVERTCLLGYEERTKFSQFKSAMRRYLVTFSTIEVYYLIAEIYENI